MTAAAEADATYDLVVVGGGSAGLEAAKFAATFDKTSLIIEKAKLGGDCTWTGCVPSKTLLSAAHAAHTVRTAAEKWGVTNAPRDAVVDFAHVMRKVTETRQRIYDKDDSVEVLGAKGVQTMTGTATFLTPDTLSVTKPDGSTTTVGATNGVLIATGAGPAPAKIDGIDAVPHLTYETVFSLTELPKRLTVVGGVRTRTPIEARRALALDGAACAAARRSRLRGDAMRATRPVCARAPSAASLRRPSLASARP